MESEEWQLPQIECIEPLAALCEPSDWGSHEEHRGLAVHSQDGEPLAALCEPSDWGSHEEHRGLALHSWDGEPLAAFYEPSDWGSQLHTNNIKAQSSACNLQGDIGVTCRHLPSYVDNYVACTASTEQQMAVFDAIRAQYHV